VIEKVEKTFSDSLGSDYLKKDTDVCFDSLPEDKKVEIETLMKSYPVDSGCHGERKYVNSSDGVRRFKVPYFESKTVSFFRDKFGDPCGYEFNELIWCLTDDEKKILEEQGLDLEYHEE